MPDYRLIDWDRVSTLRDEVGVEDFDEVVDLFMLEVDETIERLKASPDCARLEEDLHFLKGSALNLGFRDFSDLCEEGERLSASGKASAVDLTAILASYDASKQHFIVDLPTAF